MATIARAAFSLHGTHVLVYTTGDGDPPVVYALDESAAGQATASVRVTLPLRAKGEMTPTTDTKSEPVLQGRSKLLLAEDARHALADNRPGCAFRCWDVHSHDPVVAVAYTYRDGPAVSMWNAQSGIVIWRMEGLCCNGCGCATDSCCCQPTLVACVDVRTAVCVVQPGNTLVLCERGRPAVRIACPGPAAMHSLVLCDGFVLVESTAAVGVLHLHTARWVVQFVPTHTPARPVPALTAGLVRSLGATPAGRFRAFWRLHEDGTDLVDAGLAVTNSVAPTRGLTVEQTQALLSSTWFFRLNAAATHVLVTSSVCIDEVPKRQVYKLTGHLDPPLVDVCSLHRATHDMLFNGPGAADARIYHTVHSDVRYRNIEEPRGLQVRRTVTDSVETALSVDMDMRNTCLFFRDLPSADPAAPLGICLHPDTLERKRLGHACAFQPVKECMSTGAVPFRGIAFTADGKYGAWVPDTTRGELKVFKVPRGGSSASKDPRHVTVCTVDWLDAEWEFAPVGNTLVVINKDCMQCFQPVADDAPWPCTARVEYHRAFMGRTDICGLGFSPDGAYLVTQHRQECVVCLWTLPQLRLVRARVLGTGAMQELLWSGLRRGFITKFDK
jgi:hypothetical protein